MGRFFVLDNNDNQKKIFKQDFYNKKPLSLSGLRDRFLYPSPAS